MAGAIAGLLAGCGHRPLSTLAPASAQAGHIAYVWHAMAWGSLAVLVLMLALVFMAIRARGHGQAKRRAAWLLLGGGIVLPLGVMAALLAYAYVGAPAQGEPAYRVQVTAHRWWWEVRYPQAAGGVRYAVNELHLPLGVPVAIELTASDVIHSFWIPRLGGKMDAIPGRVNTLVYTADEAGVFQGQCAEYCGAGHAAMPLRVVVQDKADLANVLASLPSQSPEAPR